MLGTCDAVPVDNNRPCGAAVQEIKTMGFIYNVAEASSEANVRAAKKYCQEKGIACTEGNGGKPSEVQPGGAGACTKCDAIFTPTDNTVATGMTSFRKLRLRLRYPCLPVRTPW